MYMLVGVWGRIYSDSCVRVDPLPSSFRRGMRAHAHASSRPGVAVLVARVMSFATLACVVLWGCAVVVMRVYLFHTFYIHHLQTIEDEQWLLRQCSDPAFFANLKQHVGLCAQVQENAQRSPFLVALNETMQNSSLCGVVQCWELVQHIQGAGLSAVVLASVAAVLLVAVVLPAANIVTRFLQESTSMSHSMHAVETGVWGRTPHGEHAGGMFKKCV